MGGSGEAGPTEALDSISCCGGVEATEGMVVLDRSSFLAAMTLSDLDETNFNYNILNSPNLDD